MEHNGERVQGRLMEQIAAKRRWLVELVTTGQKLEVDEDALADSSTTTTETDASSTNNNPAVSAREARSRRRQTADTKKRKNNKNSVVTAAKRQRTEEECVKVKLLTGTLLLYRGRNPRAEFVRRV